MKNILLYKLLVLKMSNILFILIKIMLFCNVSIAMDFQRGEATIEVVSFKPRRMSKRDLSYNNERNANHNDNELIELKVHAFNTSYNLSLKPLASDRSIFGSNFVCNLLDFNDTDGGVIVQDITPSVEEMYSIQEQIYTDSKTGSAVTVQYARDITNRDKYGNLTGNDIVLNGMMHGGRIKRDVGNPHHVIELPISSQQKSNPFENDYIDLGIKLTPRSGNSQIDSNKKFSIYPELAVVADYGRRGFGPGESDEDVLRYIALLIAGLNDRYTVTDDPVIYIEVVTIHVIKVGSVPPFIARLNSSMYNDVPHYGGGPLLDSFSVWARNNQDIEGLGPNEHDLMVLLTDRPSGDGGMAFVGGVCNTNSDRNVATSWATDRFGTYGMNAMAHEIGHSLGAPHDDEHPDYLTKCIHFIMSGMTERHINSFTFSPCSLQHIKAKALSTSGACLHVKNGPVSKFRLNKNDRGIPSEQAGCDMMGGLYVHPYFQEPDDACRKIVCWSHAEKWRAGLGMISNGALCGIGGSGRCRNGYCLGDKPTTLDGICREATWDPNSFCMHPDAGSVCAAKIKCYATLLAPGSEKLQWHGIDAFPPPGTICGKNGETCTSKIRKPNGNCIVHTGTVTAVEEGEKWDTAKECSSGIRCVFGTEYEWLKEPNNGHVCDDGDGEYFEGKCIPKDGSLRFTVLDACKLITRDNKSMVNFNRFAEGELDELCSKLSCRDGKGKLREATSPTPEGTICGALKIVNLQPGYGRGTCVVPAIVSHELLHAIGFAHQQNAPGRDRYVRIEWGNIQSGAESQFQEVSSTQFTEYGYAYDYGSVMHYGAYDFSSNGGKTITTLNGASIGQRNAISSVDGNKLNKKYSCPTQ